MKISILVLFIISSLWFLCAQAGEKQPQYGRTYGDAWYEMERRYPAPERRYSRKQLDQARRRANNSLWMERNSHKDPIYQSDQYRGRSSGYNSTPYRYENNNRYGHRW